MGDVGQRFWHQALAYALSGERRAELGKQYAPDLDVVAEALAGRALGRYSVPADLCEGIGPARLAALVTAVQVRLAAPPLLVLANRVLDADERRLLTEVPPHHGS